MKPGWKTSEFWKGLAAMALTAMFASGAITNSTVLAIAGIAASTLTAMGYTVGRTIVKRASAAAGAAVLPLLAVTMVLAGSGAAHAGIRLNGPVLTGHNQRGDEVRIRIDSVQHGVGANADVWSYRLSVDGHPACVDQAGEPSDAQLVRGTWDSRGAYHADDQITVACAGSAAAKCVEFGYKPWRGYAPEMAACVRALRADFCGDGKSYTKGGTPVNIYDSRGIQTDGANWMPEAEWTPDGASCISAESLTRAAQVVHRALPCASRLENRLCGSSQIALITTELR